MGDSERGEMQRTRASSSISHSIQYPPRPLRVMNPDLETESEDDLSRSDLLPEMTLDYTSQGSLPSSAPFTPPPHSPAQAPHDIAEHLKSFDQKYNILARNKMFSWQLVLAGN